ncbi:hypothetical protein EDD22DRAFT_952697 [Suillus occidentalis]|nr:hypothetical protein EDD22DRAFT_952697 [Suillus occidentalis]
MEFFPSEVTLTQMANDALDASISQFPDETAGDFNRWKSSPQGAAHDTKLKGIVNTTFSTFQKLAEIFLMPVYQLSAEGRQCSRRRHIRAEGSRPRLGNREFKPNPPVDHEDKHCRGFVNDTCGRLLCPTEMDWSNTVVRTGIMDRTDGHVVTEMSWPAFLYDGYTADMDNLEEGLFKSKLLIQQAMVHGILSLSTDSLTHDKWLDIDYILLARSAVTCGAYTTALLFLELAAEYQSLDMGNTAGIEHLLFEIYSHIDEPDGFYGIKNADLWHCLIKRLHHEKQWEKAFRFHGAALKAGSLEAVDTDGLLSPFHAFGFDRLVIGYSSDLGWRTETWGLPDNTGDSSGVTLFQALRAINREWDPRAVDVIIRSSLNEEITRLRQLGTGNISGIREVARNIKCLEFVSSLWFATFDDVGIQDKLKAALDRVPSRKFALLSHQLSARMSKSSAEALKNQHNLQGLVLQQPQGVRRTSSRFELPSSHDPTQTTRIRSIEQVCNASLEWALHPSVGGGHSVARRRTSWAKLDVGQDPLRPNPPLTMEASPSRTPPRPFIPDENPVYSPSNGFFANTSTHNGNSIYNDLPYTAAQAGPSSASLMPTPESDPDSSKDGDDVHLTGTNSRWKYANGTWASADFNVDSECRVGATGPTRRRTLRYSSSPLKRTGSAFRVMSKHLRHASLCIFNLSSHPLDNFIRLLDEDFDDGEYSPMQDSKEPFEEQWNEEQVFLSRKLTPLRGRTLGFLDSSSTLSSPLSLPFSPVGLF